MPIVIAGILVVAAAHAAPPAFPDRCTVDRDRLLALDQRSFDQGPTGWRALAQSGCHAAAADVIGDWRTRNAASDTIPAWHEGQMRANAGQYDRAIILFERSRKKRPMEIAQAWSLHVDGGIAFLRADRPALERARNRLARMAKPAGFNPAG